jgi:hypothetical protein
MPGLTGMYPSVFRIIILTYFNLISFDRYRPLVTQNDDQQCEHTWFNEPISMSTTRAIVERRPITPSDDESTFA